MFLKIDPERPLPIFAQVMEGIRLAVATGRLRSGDRIPSIRDLAVQLRVNPNTVARAYQELERAGVVEVARGTGYFIAGTDNQLRRREREALIESRIEELLSAALELGLSPEQVKSAVERKIKELKMK